jgi:transposase InsO family protein
MAWVQTDVSEQRIRFVVRAEAGKEPLAALCREFGIARPTGYRWLKRYRQAHSVEAVIERSRRPARSPRRTEAVQEERVEALRRATGWGAKKLAVLLGEEGVPLTVITINRILQRRGLVRKEESHTPALQRFERAAPNQLWQMDGKGEYRGGEAACHPLSLLDDHSRYAVGLFALRAFTAELVYPCVIRSFERYGVPDAMLMDHGTIWWGTTNSYGLTWFSVRLIEQGIDLMYGRVNHPQTQGKVERFHRTLDEAMRYRGKPKRMAEWVEALEEFRGVYNQKRPHEALQMQRPADRYRPSMKSYQPEPREWEYPEGSRVERLDENGCLRVEGRNWFVCEALAQRRVRIERVGVLLLISYRHMYVREIDRQRGCTRALVRSRSLGRALRSPFGLPPCPPQGAKH